MQQIAQSVGAAGGLQPPDQRGRGLVGLALGAQPPAAVGVVQGSGHQSDDLRVEAPGRRRIVEQAADRGGAVPLPDPQQGVLLRLPADTQRQPQTGEFGVTAADQRGERGPAGRRAAQQGDPVDGHRLRAPGGVRGAGGDGPAQGRGGARVAVDDGVDGGIVGGDQLPEDAGVEAGVSGEMCIRDSGGVVQLRQHVGEVARVGVAEQEGQRGVDRPGRRGTRLDGRGKVLGEEVGQRPPVGRQRALDFRPALRIGAQVLGHQLFQPGGERAFAARRARQQGGQDPGGPGLLQQVEGEGRVEGAGRAGGGDQGGEAGLPGRGERLTYRAGCPGRIRGRVGRAQLGTRREVSGPLRPESGPQLLEVSGFETGQREQQRPQARGGVLPVAWAEVVHGGSPGGVLDRRGPLLLPRQVRAHPSTCL